MFSATKKALVDHGAPQPVQGGVGGKGLDLPAASTETELPQPFSSPIGEGEKYGSDRRRRGSSRGSGIPGDRERHGHSPVKQASHHALSGLGTHGAEPGDRRGRHRKELGLGTVAVGYEAPVEVGGASGYVGDEVGNEATGTGLGKGQDLSSVLEESPHNLLQGIVSLPIDEAPPQATALLRPDLIHEGP